MNDVLGNPVGVGDTVVIARTGYRDLVEATVTKITPKGIKAVFKRYSGHEEETHRCAGMFVKAVRA